jgi:DNA-binding NtrC family response regulator
LNVVAIRLAPLRERKEDIPPLVDYFLRKYGRRYHGGQVQLLPELVQAFTEYDWPGNVRELENMVRRLVVLKDPLVVLDELRAGHRDRASPLVSAPVVPVPTTSTETNVAIPREARIAYPNPFAMPQPPPPPPSMPEEEMSLKDIGKRAAMLAEREAILAMLQRTAWNKRKAASKLRISYKALLYKIKESGIIDPRAAAEL